MRLAVKVIFVVFAVIIGLQAWIVWGWWRDRRTPSRFLIPDHFVGWVCTQFEVTAASPLPVENGYVVHRYPPDGILRTSSKNLDGWARDRYYYVEGQREVRELGNTGWGEGGLVWGGQYGGPSTNDGKLIMPALCEFIGTEEQFKHAPAPPDLSKTAH